MLRFALATCMLMAILVTIAHAQDHHHPPEHAQLHDAFYQDWLRPGTLNPDGSRQPRSISCCNKMDCRPVTFDRQGGKWYARWGITLVEIPESLFEHNQPDPRESPDGGSHACISAAMVPLCAVLGSGQ